MNFTDLELFLCVNGLSFALLNYLKKKCETSTKRNSRGIGIPHPSRELHKNCVYFDYNATTPIFPEVSDKMLPYLTTSFGNPSSPHIYGKPCCSAVENARQHLALLVRAESSKNVIKNLLYKICIISSYFANIIVL